MSTRRGVSYQLRDGHTTHFIENFIQHLGILIVLTASVGIGPSLFDEYAEWRKTNYPLTIVCPQQDENTVQDQ